MTKNEFEKLPRELVKHDSSNREYVSTFRIDLPDKRVVTMITKTKIIAYNRYGKDSVAYLFRGRDYRNIDDLIKAINDK